MAKKMLIDASHPEETRVVVADGNKVEEFDFESLSKRQISGNIYLAKITRVEPSLQAAFVEYGGNRHGFLAFSEIHPDYYQIPKADRDAILAEERALVAAEAQPEEDEAADGAAAADDRDDAAEGETKKRSRSRSRRRRKADDDGQDDAGTGTSDARDVIADGAEGGEAVVSGTGGELAEAADAQTDADAETGEDPARTIAEGAGLEDQVVSEDAPDDERADGAAASPAGMDVVDLGGDDTAPVEDPTPHRGRARRRGGRADAAARDDTVETVTDDEQRDPRPPIRGRARRYKIQEVVKVRQIMLVQVVKEERGNKGAALTTYLSLAGRYCVLMPNTARGGGISRKITNAPDRKKLKEIAGEIDVPQGAGLIIRTAGAKRTKTEIKRDYEYLQRQWEQVRELTLKSIAPAPIYEEGNLIHRSIRDLYGRDIDEVIVEGEAGYRQAKDYMKLIMPSHAKNVKHYQDPLPLFARHQVETYLDSMFNPTVQLRSGGYIVIGVTEALVAIDVNSGKATRETSIEETAFKTNLEAAEEVARQAKLRDLAGLIVVDFIDMDERKNNAAVEKRLKDSLKNDRARIQVGRISGFGLLEMSRQRLRPGMLEATTQPCHHCHGTGLIRSDDSIALQVLRALEEEGTRGRSAEVRLRLPVTVANYLVNEKREHVAAIEGRYEMAVRIEVDPSLVAPDFGIERFKTASRQVPKALANVIQHDLSWTPSTDEEDGDEVEEEDGEAEAEAGTAEADGGAGTEARDRGTSASDGDEDRPRKKRRRRSRRRRGGNGEDRGEDRGGDDRAESEGGTGDGVERPTADPVDAESVDAEVELVTPDPVPESEVAPKPKSRTRSRGRRKAAEDGDAAEAVGPAGDATAVDESTEAAATVDAAPEPEAETAKPRSRSRARAKAPATEAAPASVAEATVGEDVVEAAEAADAAMEAVPEPEPAAEAKPRRRGWWSRG